MKPLLVGEANPYGNDPRFALYPYPERASGHRLAVLVMGMEPRQYIRAFDRVNLCPERWSVGVARERADAVKADPSHRVIVLLGSKVAAAFGVKYEPFTVHELWPGFLSPPCLAKKRFVVLPHPSGLCRAWNEPGSFDKARRVLRAAGVLP